MFTIETSAAYDDNGNRVTSETNENGSVRITKTGYIKSRFLDDKLSVGILLGFAKYIRDEKITPSISIRSTAATWKRP